MLKNEALKEEGLTLARHQNQIQKLDIQIESKSEFVGAICPNCGAGLEGRKCKLFCPTWGCGYLVTCSEW